MLKSWDDIPKHEDMSQSSERGCYLDFDLDVRRMRE